MLKPEQMFDATVWDKTSTKPEVVEKPRTTLEIARNVSSEFVSHHDYRHKSLPVLLTIVLTKVEDEDTAMVTLTDEPSSGLGVTSCFKADQHTVRGFINHVLTAIRYALDNRPDWYKRDQAKFDAETASQ